MGKKGTYSIWLVPSKRDCEHLSEQVMMLAKKYRSFIFTPHITLYRVKNISLDVFISRIRPCISALTAFSLSLDTPQSGQMVNRTLYYPVQKSAQLDSLYSSLHTSLGEFGNFPYDPHISILYNRRMSENEKNRSITDVVPITSVHISKLFIIQSLVSLTEGADVPQWKVIHEQLLY